MQPESDTVGGTAEGRLTGRIVHNHKKDDNLDRIDNKVWHLGTAYKKQEYYVVFCKTNGARRHTYCNL